MKNPFLTIIIVSIMLLLTAFTTKNVNNKNKGDSKMEKANDLVFYVQFHLKPEFVDDFRKSLLDVINNMSKEDEFISSFLHQDSEDQTKFTIYERWNEESMDAFIEKHLKGKEYRNDYEARIHEWSETTRNISVLNPLKEWENPNLMPSDNDLAFYVNFHIKPEFVEEWKDAALVVLNSMSVEDTFVSAYLHQDSKDPHKFTLYERWNEPSMDEFVKNQLNAKNYRKVYEEKLPEMVQSPRTFSVLKPIESKIK